MNKDKYFFDLCTVVGNQVQCPSRQIGVVIGRDKLVVATGFNGPPSGFPHPETCVRKDLGIPSGEQLSLCPCAHAERNAIAFAARMGHSTDGCSLYLNTILPCLDCAASIVAAGIKEVVVSYNEDYRQLGFVGRDILLAGGVEIREFNLG